MYSFLNQGGWGERRHIKLKCIHKFILICISISEESVPQTESVYLESSLRGDPPSPVRGGKWSIWVRAGMTEVRWNSVWLQSLRSPPSVFDPVFRSAGFQRTAPRAGATAGALAWRRGPGSSHKLRTYPQRCAHIQKHTITQTHEGRRTCVQLKSVCTFSSVRPHKKIITIISFNIIQYNYRQHLTHV